MGNGRDGVILFRYVRAVRRRIVVVRISQYLCCANLSSEPQLKEMEDYCPRLKMENIILESVRMRSPLTSRPRVMICLII